MAFIPPPPPLWIFQRYTRPRIYLNLTSPSPPPEDPKGNGPSIWFYIFMCVFVPLFMAAFFCLIIFLA